MCPLFLQARALITFPLLLYSRFVARVANHPSYKQRSPPRLSRTPERKPTNHPQNTAKHTFDRSVWGRFWGRCMHRCRGLGKQTLVGGWFATTARKIFAKALARYGTNSHPPTDTQDVIHPPNPVKIGGQHPYEPNRSNHRGRQTNQPPTTRTRIDKETSPNTCVFSSQEVFHNVRDGLAAAGAR